MTTENFKLIDIALFEIFCTQKSGQKEINKKKDSDEINRFSAENGGSPNKKDSDEINGFSAERADHLITSGHKK